MAVVDPGTVAEFLGWGEPDSATVTALSQSLTTVTGLASGWTRGRGFDDDGMPNDDLASVIVAATARLVSNPAQYAREEIDGYTATGGFSGWTLAEQAVLNRYRRKAA